MSSSYWLPSGSFTKWLSKISGSEQLFQIFDEPSSMRSFRVSITKSPWNVFSIPKLLVIIKHRQKRNSQPKKKTRETSKALNHAINQKKKAAAQELNIQMIHSDMVRFDFLILIPPVPQTRRLSSQPFVQVNKNMNIRLHPSLDCAEHVAFLLMMTVPIQIVYRRRMFIDFSISLLIIISLVRQWNGEPLWVAFCSFKSSRRNIFVKENFIFSVSINFKCSSSFFWDGKHKVFCCRIWLGGNRALWEWMERNQQSKKDVQFDSH